jgi:uncharacterized membrane protein
MSVRKTILTALACGYLILWVGGVGSHLLFGGTPADTAWAAPAFLSLAGMIVLAAANGGRRAALLAVGAIGVDVKAVGVHTGFPFGRYQYTGVLQPQVIGVPLVMAAAWMVLVAYVKAMLAGFRPPYWLEALIASLWMTAIDLVIDPLAAGALGYWRWIDSGAYYGIPSQNFLGWFVVSWFVFSFLKAVHVRPWQPDRWASAVGLSVTLFFTFIALAHHLRLVAGFGFGLILAHLVIARHKQASISHQPSTAERPWRRAGQLTGQNNER